MRLCLQVFCEASKGDLETRSSQKSNYGSLNIRTLICSSCIGKLFDLQFSSALIGSVAIELLGRSSWILMHTVKKITLARVNHHWIAFVFSKVSQMDICDIYKLSGLLGQLGPALFTLSALLLLLSTPLLFELFLLLFSLILASNCFDSWQFTYCHSYSIGLKRACKVTSWLRHGVYRVIVLLLVLASITILEFAPQFARY